MSNRALLMNMATLLVNKVELLVGEASRLMSQAVLLFTVQDNAAFFRLGSQ